MACDYCGKIVKDLHELRGYCATNKVKMICGSCVKIFNKKKDFFMFSMSEKRMKLWVNRTRKRIV